MKSLLPYDFYNRATATVARELVGQILVRKHEGVEYSGTIVETEAYLPFDDPASHSFIGKTIRNAVMFGDAGYTYIYSIHQVYCLNIVTEQTGVPGAVLIRALEPLSGIEPMKLNRKSDEFLKLMSGPGKLCQAMQITRADNGKRLFEENSGIYVLQNGVVRADEIVATTRVGISKATDLPLRFYLKGNAYVSR